jgi:hypothetical protein
VCIRFVAYCALKKVIIGNWSCEATGRGGCSKYAGIKYEVSWSMEDR